MSIIDAKLELCDATDLGSVAGSGVFASAVAIGNSLDLGAAGVDGWGNSLTEGPGEGQELSINLSINTVLSAHELTVFLASDGALSSSDLSSANQLASVTFPASSPAGTKRTISVPAGNCERYIQLMGGGAAALTGKLDAWISSVPQDTNTAMK